MPCILHERGVNAVRDMRWHSGGPAEMFPLRIFEPVENGPWVCACGWDGVAVLAVLAVLAAVRLNQPIHKRARHNTVVLDQFLLSSAVDAAGRGQRGYKKIGFGF